MLGVHVVQRKVSALLLGVPYQHVDPVCSVLQRQFPHTKIQAKFRCKLCPTTVSSVRGPKGSAGHLGWTLQGSRICVVWFLLALGFAGFGLAMRLPWPPALLLYGRSFLSTGQKPVLNACWFVVVVGSWRGLLVALFCPLFLWKHLSFCSRQLCSAVESLLYGKAAGSGYPELPVIYNYNSFWSSDFASVHPTLPSSCNHALWGHLIAKIWGKCFQHLWYQNVMHHSVHLGQWLLWLAPSIKSDVLIGSDRAMKLSCLPD